jgi:hypothetical protein
MNQSKYFINEVHKFYDKISNEYYYDNETRIYDAINKEEAYLKNPDKFLEIFDGLWDNFYFGEGEYII